MCTGARLSRISVSTILGSRRIRVRYSEECCVSWVRPWPLFPGAGFNSYIFAAHQPARTDIPLIYKNAPMPAGEKDELTHSRTAVLEDLGSSTTFVRPCPYPALIHRPMG
jgi:hypothetical protein